MHSLTKRRLVASEDDHEHSHQSEVGHSSNAEGPRIEPLRDGVDEQQINENANAVDTLCRARTLQMS